MNLQADQALKTIWDYMLLHEKPQRADVILVLGSRDERVADYAARLYMQGLGNLVLFSGGVTHSNDLLRTTWGSTEAEYFSNRAKALGVPEDKILLENKASNTGENIILSHKLLKSKGIKPESVLLVQKPYMERRTFATFAKQWPDSNTKFQVTSPDIEYDDYFDSQNPKDEIAHIIVGDLRRIIEYPKSGFQIEQDVPVNVLEAEKELINLGYTKHLI